MGIVIHVLEEYELFQKFAVYSNNISTIKQCVYPLLFTQVLENLSSPNQIAIHKDQCIRVPLLVLSVMAIIWKETEYPAVIEGVN